MPGHAERPNKQVPLLLIKDACQTMIPCLRIAMELQPLRIFLDGAHRDPGTKTAVEMLLNSPSSEPPELHEEMGPTPLSTMPQNVRTRALHMATFVCVSTCMRGGVVYLFFAREDTVPIALASWARPHPPKQKGQCPNAAKATPLRPCLVVLTTLVR